MDCMYITTGYFVLYMFKEVKFRTLFYFFLFLKVGWGVGRGLIMVSLESMLCEVRWGDSIDLLRMKQEVAVG